MADASIVAEPRNDFGKGAARRARRDHKIPAVIYGHGDAPIHVLLPERVTARAVRMANALLAISINGGEHLVLAKDVQRDPVRQVIEHIDLLAVRQGEKVDVDVPVVVHGEPAPGLVVNQEEVTVRLSAEATHLPEHVEVSMEGREAGQHVLAKDIELPANVTLLTDPELLIVHISAPTARDLGTAQEVPAAAAEEAAPAAE